MSFHSRQALPLLLSTSIDDFSLFFSAPLTSPLVPFSMWPSSSRFSFLHTLQSQLRASPSHPAHSPRLRFRSWRPLPLLSTLIPLRNFLPTLLLPSYSTKPSLPSPPINLRSFDSPSPSPLSTRHCCTACATRLRNALLKTARQMSTRVPAVRSLSPSPLFSPSSCCLSLFLSYFLSLSLPPFHSFRHVVLGGRQFRHRRTHTAPQA